MGRGVFIAHQTSNAPLLVLIPPHLKLVAPARSSGAVIEAQLVEASPCFNVYTAGLPLLLGNRVLSTDEAQVYD